MMEEKIIEPDEIETVTDKVKRKRRKLKEDDIFVRNKKKDETKGKPKEKPKNKADNKLYEKKLSNILRKIHDKKLNKDDDIKKVLSKLKNVF